MVDKAAPAGTVTEAFAWLATAVAIGAAAGAAIAGAVAESFRPAVALALGGAAGCGAARDGCAGADTGHARRDHEGMRAMPPQDRAPSAALPRA